VDDLPKTATGKIQRFKLREKGRRARHERRRVVQTPFVDIDWAGRPVRIEHAWWAWTTRARR
jgi:hypothetical protein